MSSLFDICLVPLLDPWFLIFLCPCVLYLTLTSSIHICSNTVWKFCFLTAKLLPFIAVVITGTPSITCFLLVHFSCLFLFPQISLLPHPHSQQIILLPISLRKMSHQRRTSTSPSMASSHVHAPEPIYVPFLLLGINCSFSQPRPARPFMH